MPGGELAKRCFDCGSCTGACPVSGSGTGFDPRKILHMIKLGLKDQLLRSAIIWHCSHCDTCYFVCPQGVRFSSVVDVLREMAVKQGFDDGKGVEKWGTAPCKATCPAHISIPGFVGAIAEGRYEDGLKLIKEEMPFPGICGRVCHHPCEKECNRGKLNNDKPIAIEYLKRFLSDVNDSKELKLIPAKKPDKNEKVAVIGAGPAGLTAAYYLAREGYGVTVFEKLPVVGGMMAVGIPEYRLPRGIIAAEVQVIRQLGVKIKNNVTFGKDVTLEKLKKEGYKAVFIGTGLHLSRRLYVPGEDFPGILGGVDFLRDAALGNPVTMGKRTTVIGGGNVAIDVALVALRKGAEQVTLVSLEQRHEMPAWDYEIAETLEEGINIINGWGPKRFLQKDGKVSGLEFKRCSAVFDDKCVFNPQYDEKDLMSIECDTVIVAIGQAGDVAFAKTEGVPLTPRGGLAADPVTFQTALQWVFAGGDGYYGPKSVVEAVACGKEAAISIDRYLRGEDLKKDRGRDWKGIEYKPKVEKKERMLISCISLDDRKGNFKEVHLGFNKEQATGEAERCLRLCGMQRTDVK